MPNPSRPTDPSWRKGVKPAERKQEALPQWRREQQDQAGPADGKRRRALKIGTGVVGIMAGIAGLIGLVLLLRPVSPVHLILAGSGYEHNLAVPHNAYGWLGLNHLVAWADSHREGTSRWDAGKVEVVRPLRLRRDDLESFEQQLANSKSKTVVLALALHGGADKDGAYFFLDDARGTDPESVLRLGKVLELLARLPEQTKKLLILDATQAAANWPSGMLFNAFAQQLEKEVADRKVPGLVVISSSSPDQQSWPCEPWQETLFNHYMIEGLNGAADLPSEGGDGNGRVTALELFGFVQKKTKERAASMYDQAVQEPVLLPRDSAGTELARSIELVMARSTDLPKPGPESDVVTKMEPLWSQWQELRDQVPSPAVVNPQLWRRYQDTLVRYEQLVRAGDEEAAPLLDDLRHLKEEIQHPLLRDASSLQNTLAMPAALGVNVSPAKEKEWRDHFIEIWDRPRDKQPEDALGNWLFQVKGPDQAVLRTQIAALLLARALAEPEQLSKVLRLMHKLDDAQTPRPAESHLLTMFDHLYEGVLTRDGVGAARPESKLLQQVLKTRLLAEETALTANLSGPDQRRVHPYSEQVHPWIKNKVEAADQERRLAEDLLFAPPSHAKQAEAHATTSMGTYAEAQKAGLALREAFAIRDRVLADLPYYALWSIQHRGTDSGARVDSVEQLALKTHELARLLNPNQSPLPWPVPEPIKSLTADVAAGFKDLNARFELQCDSLIQERTLQGRRHETEAALSIPLLKPSTRLALLRNAIRTALALTEKASAAESVPSSQTDVEQHSAWQAAQRQGRMARAVLGKDWITQCGENDFNLENELKSSAQDDWHSAFSRAGAKIGKCWHTLPARINQLADQQQKETLAQAEAHLHEAAGLCLLLDGAGAGELGGINPVVANRAAQLHDLLLWQAQRTYSDHWFDETEKRYYELAGNLYVHDAEQLAASTQTSPDPKQKEARLSGVLAMRKRLAENQQFEVAGPDPIDWTSERQHDLNYVLKAPPELLPGLPVLWRPVDKRLLDFEQSQAASRTVVDEFGTEKPAAEHRDRFSIVSRFFDKDERDPPRRPRKESTRIALKGVYRGQIINKETPITFHRGSDITASRFPALLYGNVAIHADPSVYERYSVANGAIAIVIDYSGSMGKMEEQGSKINQALQALRTVLSELPNGVAVSVWVFSQQVPKAVWNRPGFEVEDTITQLRAPEPWDISQLPDLMARLRALEPNQSTPLVRAMYEAAQKDLRNGRPGFKTLLVLTDGMDNRFVKGVGVEDPSRSGDPKLNPNSQGKSEEIRDHLLKEYKDSGITINMSFFRVSEDEIDKAKQQFKAIESLDPPGRAYEAKDITELTKQLRANAEQHLRCRLIRSNGQAVPPATGMEVTRGRNNPAWFPGGIKQDVYTAEVQTAKLLKQEMRFGNGDFLLARLSNNGFERELLADNCQPTAPPVTKGDWQLSVLQNQQLLPTAPLQLLVAIEDAKNRKVPEGHLQQNKPTFSWFELKRGSRQPRFSLHFGNLALYPAYSIGLDVPWWPMQEDSEVGALPVLEAWWLTNGPPQAAQVVPRNPSVTLDADFKSPQQVAGDNVTIESVQFEDSRLIQTSAEDKRPVPCLVVRVHHAPDKPVFVQLMDLPHQGEEHRLYKEADRTTSIFWEVPKSAAAEFKLGLVSLEALKKNASYSGPINLPQPNPLQIRQNILRAPVTHQ
jgi:hypothetical protein